MTREEAIAYFNDMNECTYGDVEPIQMAINALKQEPREHGEWIKMPLTEVGQTYSHKCSLCGRRILATNKGLSEFPYCHCGADMRKEQNNV